ncbi:nucleotidyltransferase [Acidianus sp. HS-5]|uniref:nucleotidyltransferase n=1 Tax=Acidianus sp. HS-5 TaxID=2886040 RepID=UPI001F3E09F7|nr:nucleotidyltransferase [Acidianus sp. HS-5]BDC17912.1 hypothetical protein HS5_08020 [Acidianus sp. HS-5]
MEKEAKELRKLISALEESNCEYVIVGGLVAIHYGRNRVTQDIDVIVGNCDIKVLLNALVKQGFEFSRQELEEAFKERGRITLFIPEDVLFHVDLKFASDDLDLEVLKDRVRDKLMGIDCWIESVEDIIVAKLIYGSSQDEEDVIAVLLNKGIGERLKEKAKKFKAYNKLCGIAEMIGLVC